MYANVNSIYYMQIELVFSLEFQFAFVFLNK